MILFLSVDNFPAVSAEATGTGIGPAQGLDKRFQPLVIESFFQAKPAAHPQDKLTTREEEILDHLAKGFVTKEIADKLAISPATVRFHLRHIYDKLHVRCRTEAAAKYLRAARGSRPNISGFAHWVSHIGARAHGAGVRAIVQVNREPVCVASTT